MIATRTFSAPPVCEREIWRYAGCRKADGELKRLLDMCLEEAKEQLVYRVCYDTFPVTVIGDRCDFGVFCVTSASLATRLNGVDEAVVFGATVGVELDRLIAKYGRTAPTKALLLQAVGAERVEALCDAFCAAYTEEHGGGLTARFSAGYGDMPLEAQRDIFAVLDLPRKIGLTLNDSLMMSPSKSVTAIAGRTTAPKTEQHKCDRCAKTDCAFRSSV